MALERSLCEHYRLPCQGYILLTVGVFGAGDAIPVVEEEHVTQSAGGEEIKRVTGAPELKFQSFNLIVNIHRGHDIVIYSGATPSPFVRVGLLWKRIRSCACST